MIYERRIAVAILLSFGMAMVQPCWAQTYKVASEFETGFKDQANPNGVWSYGYSSGFTGAITLFTKTVEGGFDSANQQVWIAPSVNDKDSPAAIYNDGPAFNDGNVNMPAHAFELVAGIGGQYADLVFTAPKAGKYKVSSTFRGDQNHIGVFVGVVKAGKIVFSSTVTQEGQLVHFHRTVTLTAGETIAFSVGPDDGLQNTGLAAQLTFVGAN